MDLASYLKERKDLVDRALADYCADRGDAPPRLTEAMRYSVLAGGKRVRPILCLAGAAAVGGEERAVLSCACALELIHTFSLIHDDLPAMDNDDLRRGRPTNHKVFGEAMAILAGDGLLAEAFRLMIDGMAGSDRLAACLLPVLGDIAEATGPSGMVGGQVLDMQAEGQALTAEAILHLHRLKTGALIRVAAVSGAKLAGADPAQVAALTRYGEAIGQAFQIADDILGAEGNAAEMGKPVGSDAARGKATYPSVVGMAAARERMLAAANAGIAALADFDDRAEPLRQLARYITQRRR
ncbi:MAG: polyprenyl synthetase family protein [Deltaproteobacteria bacterium]|nr:polyprenyl synthetase family protein [Deltaproteobacteria bacterium]